MALLRRIDGPLGSLALQLNTLTIELLLSTMTSSSNQLTDLEIET
jgi:hypothetical protein